MTSQILFSVKMPPKKPTNAERRSREYLTSHEIDQVIVAARKVGRHSSRDSTLVLLMYRHGLRVAEAVSLAGMPSICRQVCSMSTGSKMAKPLSILYVARNFELYGSYAGTIRIRLICLSLNGAGH